jgi:pyruvate/2-oxoglutarate dehydrogenase complex dihydrolipoamide acyltransferase (E2) component
MAQFTVPCDMHINTGGDLNIPAGASVQVTEDGEYAGYVTPEGMAVFHRGQEGSFEVSESSLTIVGAEMPPATPAAVAHAEETGVDLTQVEGSGADGKITKADVAAAAEAGGPTTDALKDDGHGEAD